MSLGVGNVFLNQKNSAGGITGTGTTNYLPLWTGATALGDSYIYQSTGYVNIPVKLSLASSITYSSGNAILEDVNWTINVPASTTFPQSVIDSISNVFTMNFAGAATIPNTARNTAFNSIINTGFVGASAISYTQSTGVRALSTFQSYFQVTNGFASVITHAANIQIKCDEIFGSTSILYTNRYGLLINDLNETASALITYTNRWAIYQQGVNDLNYFAANTLIGSTTSQGAYKLQVSGNAVIADAVTGFATLKIGQAYIQQPDANACYFNGQVNNVYIMTGSYAIACQGSNVGIGASTAPTMRLQVYAGRFGISAGAAVASAGDLTLGADGNVFSITGTTTINAITTTNWQAGSEITLIFAAALTVSNNVAGGANTAKLRLNGGVNFSATANDVLKLVYNGTDWLETSRSLNV